MSSAQYIDLTMLERKKKALIAEAPPLMPKQEELLEKLLKIYGLEVVLYAIDNFSYASRDSLPEPEGLIYHMKEAQAWLANLELRRTMG